MRSSRLALIPAVALTFAAPLSACSSEEATTDSSATSNGSVVRVVATTTMLGDVATQIVTCANPEASVTTLMPIGADPHDFSPSSAQVAEMVQADIVITNGLELEAGLDDALENAASDGATVIEIAAMLDPIPFGVGEHSHDEGDDEHADDEVKEDDHGSQDPHFWFDMNRMATAAQIIGDELATTGGQAYADCGAQIADEIRAAETEVRAVLESVPADQRILVTDHDALGYLADVYGYEIAGTVIPAGTTLAEPSSADLAGLVKVMQDEGVRAVFANTADPTALSDAVADEVGGDVKVVNLFVGSLGGPGSGAEDYISMMRTNADLIASALKS